MNILTVIFGCRLTDQATLSRYKGSMLRGILGGSLRKAVCMTRKDDCAQCMLNNTCIFTRLFTASMSPEGSATAPLLAPPYFIEPPLDQKCVYQAGELFTFTLVLFSYATEYLPYFVHAISLAGKRGMGKITEQGQGKFVLEQVLSNGQSLYDAEKESLAPFAAQELSLPTFRGVQTEGLKELRLNFHTPVRFKQSNHLSAELPFSQLITLILRRMKSLWALEGQSIWIDDFNECMDAANQVILKHNMLQWQDWSRYSGKQNTKMQFGGLLGSVIYEGYLDGFMEFINFACKVHIGKQTSFGLGLLDIERRGLP